MKRGIVILAMFASIFGLIAWRFMAKNAETQMNAQGRTAAAKSAPPVTVAPVVSRDIVRNFTGVGTVEAPLSVKIAPKVTGRLDYLQVREGAAVKRGEVLARIDPSQIQAQVSQQQAAVAEAQARLAQAQLTQNPTNVNVASQIQQQVSGVKSARADEHQFRTTYNMLVAAGAASIADAQGRIDNAMAAIANAEANIRSAQANFSNAQIRYNRTYDLYKQGFVAAQDVDDVKAALNVQQEAVEVARGQLNSAKAVRDSAVQQKANAEQQSQIGKTRAKADIESATAKVEQAEASLKYARSNTAQKPAYEQNLAALRSAVTAAQAQLRNIQSQLSDTVLTSPIDGFVVARLMDPGAIVSPTQPLLTVQAIRAVFVNVSVPEDVNSKLRVGQAATVTLDALPGRKLTGNITQITPAADPQTRQFPIRVTLDNRDNSIKPGSFARVSLVTQKIPAALVVPREAIQQGKSGAAVWVIDKEGVAARRLVQVGADDGSEIQIREGVREGENVVTLTNVSIKDGQKVRMVTANAPGTDSASAR